MNRIDAWIGGLAEQEVAGGMLGSTFDAVFAIQIMNLQNGDHFYYLGRVPNTEFFVEGMQGNQYSDLVMRNSTATDIYGDIFSVADSYELAQRGNLTAGIGGFRPLQRPPQLLSSSGNTDEISGPMRPAPAWTNTSLRGLGGARLRRCPAGSRPSVKVWRSATP